MVRARMTVVCEVGPAAVRNPATGLEGLPGPVEAVLAAGVEPVALLGERALPTAELWHLVLEPLLAGAADVRLVHPSWWPPAQVNLVAAAAGRHAQVVTAVARQCLHDAAAFIEIGPDFVAIGTDGRVTGAETRCADVETVVDRVVRRIGEGPDPVRIDVPAAVPGGQALAALIARRLRSTGRSVRDQTDRHLLGGAAAPTVAPASAGPRIGPAVRTLVMLAGVAVVASIGIRHQPDSASAATDLVEGRVTVRVPGDWVVRRVTAGPGSARVEVSDPADPEAVLHITQSRVRTTDLADTAATLRAAVAAQPPGVFVDFTGTGQRVGRPAVTYRELRAGREIAWTVLLSGRVRISIGCQSTGAAVCDQAVGSAREIG